METRTEKTLKPFAELKAEDIMTAPVITLNADTVLREAAQIMSDEKISGALVNDHRNVAVGVVSLFDIATCLAGLDRPAGEPGGFYRQSYPVLSEEEEEWERKAVEEDENPFGEMKVGEIMATEIIAVAPGLPLAKVSELMHERRIHRVFVTGVEGPLGVISTMDILGALGGKRKS